MSSYCTTADVQSILSEHGVTAYTDDDLDGTTDGTLIADAIERTATLKIDFIVGQRYKLTDLASNTWVKWANATLAAADLSTRRNMPMSESLAVKRQEVIEQLTMVATGQARIPGEPERMDHLPSVTNYDVERWRRRHPVRVVGEESTADSPGGDIRRWLARPIYDNDAT